MEPSNTELSTLDARRARFPGLPWAVVIGLAMLAIPRVVLHDLGLIEEGTGTNAVLVFVPPAVWVAVALWRRVPKPFVTLLAIGALSGVFLTVGHQLLWDVGFGDDPPRLGGNLTDLDPAAQAAIVRFFAAVSSLFTGVIIGAITGLIAWGLSKITRRTAADA